MTDIDALLEYVLSLKVGDTWNEPLVITSFARILKNLKDRLERLEGGRSEQKPSTIKFREFL